MTPTTPHTPGPWTVDDHRSPAKIMSAAEPHAALAMVYLTAPGGGKRDATHEANARLIAVAPEMRAQLAEFAAMGGDDFAGVSHEDAIAVLRGVVNLSAALVSKADRREG